MDSSNIDVSDDVIVVSSDNVNAISVAENADDTGSANVRERNGNETSAEMIIINLVSSESEHNESDEQHDDGDAEDNSEHRGNPVLTDIRENLVPAVSENSVLLTMEDITDQPGATINYRQFQHLHWSSSDESEPEFGFRNRKHTVKRKNLATRRNPITLNSICNNAGSPRLYVDPFATRPYMRRIVNNSSLERSNCEENGENSDTHENCLLSASESPIFPVAQQNLENVVSRGNRIPSNTRANVEVSATRDNSVTPTRDNSVTPTRENSVVLATHENSANPVANRSSNHSSGISSSSTSDDSESECRCKGKRSSGSRPTKRPRLSDRRNLAQGVADVAVASASNVSPAMAADNVVELPTPNPNIAAWVTEESRVQVVDPMDEIVRHSERTVAEFLRPRLPLLASTDRTHDFQRMNQRMQVLERSMRYVAAQIVAMTANRPSPANMRLWAQQQCRAEQERMRSMTQLLPNVSNSHALTETQLQVETRAQLRLHFNTQLEAQAQEQIDAHGNPQGTVQVDVNTGVRVEEHAEDNVHGLSEQSINEHLNVNTDEFVYTVNSTRETKCIICYEDFDKGVIIRRLRCEHCFHRNCVDHWFTTSQLRCPMCRANVIVDNNEVD